MLVGHKTIPALLLSHLYIALCVEEEQMGEREKGREKAQMK